MPAVDKAKRGAENSANSAKLSWTVLSELTWHFIENCKPLEVLPGY